MAPLLNFIVGGGLLALVQAILSAWEIVQAKQAGANSTALAQDTKVISDVSTAKQIDAQVSVMPIADVNQQLQQFTRD